MIAAALIIQFSANAQSFSVTDLHGTWTGTDQHGTAVILTFDTDYTVDLTFGSKGLPVTSYRVPMAGASGNSFDRPVILIGTSLPVPDITINSSLGSSGISSNYPYGNLVYICNATMNATFDELILEIDLTDGYIENNSDASDISIFTLNK
jgi:hypothetical protein